MNDDSPILAIVMAAQALGLGAAGVAGLTGAGVGTTTMRIGVGLCFLALALITAGIGLSLSEGQPQAPGAALALDGFALGLLVLWLAPIPALIGAGVLAVVAVFTAVGVGVRRTPRFALVSRADGRLELRHRVGSHRA